MSIIYTFNSVFDFDVIFWAFHIWVESKIYDKTRDKLLRENEKKVCTTRIYTIARIHKYLLSKVQL